MVPVTRELAELSWPVRTERLVLRPARAEDAAAIWSFWRRPEVHRWITRAPSDEAVFTERFNAPARLASTCVIELEGSVIGDLMVGVEDGWAQAEVAEQAHRVQAELGWSLDPTYGGQGYATEAVTALLGICFDGLGLRRVVANCFAANTASYALMERVGMRREGVMVADSLHRDLGWLDGYSYALLADEWRASRG